LSRLLYNHHCSPTHPPPPPPSLAPHPPPTIHCIAFTTPTARPLTHQSISALSGPTYPNRQFVHSGAAHGETDDEVPPAGFPQKTIYRQLEESGKTWKMYVVDGLSSPFLIIILVSLCAAACVTVRSLLSVAFPAFPCAILVPYILACTHSAKRAKSIMLMCMHDHGPISTTHHPHPHPHPPPTHPPTHAHTHPPTTVVQVLRGLSCVGHLHGRPPSQRVQGQPAGDDPVLF
jgi:hypothetical protein